MKKLFILLFFMAFSIMSFGQSTSTKTATATATIISPISLSASVLDMNFGEVVSSAAGGTVLIDPATPTSRTLNGVTTVPSHLGTITAAKFSFTGEVSYTFTITLPSSALTITRSSPSVATMTVDTFTSSPSSSGTISATAGNNIIYVGATLHVGANQPSGVYTSLTPFDVKIDYN